MQDDTFHITKPDAAAMLEYLIKTAPEIATPENAIWLLEQRKIEIENLEKYHPEAIMAMIQERQSQ